MASVEYLPARKLKRLIKELLVCADALHKQLDETKAQCAIIEEVMREIRRQTVISPPSRLEPRSEPSKYEANQEKNKATKLSLVGSTRASSTRTRIKTPD